MQQPRNNKNRMQRNNKNRPFRNNNNQNRGSGGNQPQGGRRININHVTNQRDKFQNQARDAQHGGDRVLMEYYLQHADHYQRLINEFNEEQEARRAQFSGSDQPSEAEEDIAARDDAPLLATAAVPLPPSIPQDTDDLEPKDV